MPAVRCIKSRSGLLCAKSRASSVLPQLLKNYINIPLSSSSEDRFSNCVFFFFFAKNDFITHFKRQRVELVQSSTARSVCTVVGGSWSSARCWNAPRVLVYENRSVDTLKAWPLLEPDHRGKYAEAHRGPVCPPSLGIDLQVHCQQVARQKGRAAGSKVCC